MKTANLHFQQENCSHNPFSLSDSPQLQALAVLPPAPGLSLSVPPSHAALEQDDAVFLPQLDVNFPVYCSYMCDVEI